MKFTDLDTVMSSTDAMFTAIKRLRAIKNRYETKAAAEKDARGTIKELQEEAHATTSAMVNGDDTDAHRDLAVIQKALQKANNKLDKAIEKTHDDRGEAQEALGILQMAVLGDLATDPVFGDEA